MGCVRSGSACALGISKFVAEEEEEEEEEEEGRKDDDGDGGGGWHRGGREGEGEGGSCGSCLWGGSVNVLCICCSCQRGG